MNGLYLIITFAIIAFCIAFFSYTGNIMPLILVICVYGIFMMTYLVECKTCKKDIESFMNYMKPVIERFSSEEKVVEKFTTDDDVLDEEFFYNYSKTATKTSTTKTNTDAEEDYDEDDIYNLKAEIRLLIEEMYRVLIPLKERIAYLKAKKDLTKEEAIELVEKEKQLNVLYDQYMNKIQRLKDKIYFLTMNKVGYDGYDGKANYYDDDDDEDLSEIKRLKNRTDDDLFVRACNVEPSKVIYNKNPDPDFWVRKDSIPCWGCNLK